MQNFLHSRFGAVALSLALMGMIFVAARTISQKYQIDKQMKQLQAHADEIKGENQNLSDLVNYLQTDQYKEKAAREQLNLKKDGEVVVALPNQDDGQVSAASTVIEPSNPKKWYEYFFQHNQE